MSRKTKKQIVQRILHILEKKPSAINEIAENLDSNWDTVERYLGLLKELGQVEEDSQDNKRLFMLKKKELILRDDTLFGIPLDRDSEELCKHLFIKVKSRWEELKGTSPNRTQMQKSIAEIADRLQLNIPGGWYLFGKMVVLTYDPEREYSSSYSKRISGLTEVIDEAIKIYSKYEKMKEVQLEQYRRRDNILYLNALSLKTVLCSRIDESSKSSIISLLYSLALSFPKKEDNKKIIELLNNYVSTVSRLLLEKSQKDIEDSQILISDTFTALWELIASYNLFNDLVEGKFLYERGPLFRYFKNRLDVLERICEDYLYELDSIIVNKPTDKNSWLFKLMGSAKLKVLTEEEKKKLFEDYENKNTSDAFRKADLD